MNNLAHGASHVHMNHRISLPIVASLAILSLCSCVDPYYGGGYSYSGSATFSTLPLGYRTIYVGGTPYYYCDNRWYRRSGGHYILCPRPLGYHGSLGKHHHYSSISRLPYGCRTTYVGGHRYYHHGDTWYRKSRSGYVTCPKLSGHSSHSYKRTHSSHKHQDDRKTHCSGESRHSSIKSTEHSDNRMRHTRSSPLNRSDFFHKRSKSIKSPNIVSKKNTTKSLMTTSKRCPKTDSKPKAVKRPASHDTKRNPHRPKKGESSTVIKLRDKFAPERD